MSLFEGIDGITVVQHARMKAVRDNVRETEVNDFIKNQPDPAAYCIGAYNSVRENSPEIKDSPENRSKIAAAIREIC